MEALQSNAMSQAGAPKQAKLLDRCGLCVRHLHAVAENYKQVQR